jgi:DNA-binding MarR family transcriptional regulator
MADRSSHVREVSDLYIQVLHELNRNSVPYWLELDLTFQQMKVLYLLKQKGPLKMSELSRLLRVSMPTITGIISRLVERGEGSALVTRAASVQDRRQVWAHLTEAGMAVTEQLDKLNRQLLETSLAQLSESELETARNGLNSLVAAVKDQPPAAVAAIMEPITTKLNHTLGNANPATSIQGEHQAAV